MPSLMRFLRVLTLMFLIAITSAYILAVFFEPSPREIRHENLKLTLEDPASDG